jgi:hypothetical protein
MWRSFVFLVACSRATPAPATYDTANAAYDAKQWASCATQYMEVAKTVPKQKKDSLYNAACCYALDGKVDRAFAALDELVTAGDRNLEHLQADQDLASLHADPRWQSMVSRVEAQIAAWEKSLGNPALRRELLDRVKKDQDARFAFIAKEKAGEKADFSAAEAVDAESLVFLHHMVDTSGWPGKTLVGEDGAHAAWLLVQHADKDVAFQKDVLARIKALGESEVSMIDYAYLYDRVAVGEHRKQLYGTQFDEHQQPQPIEDEANVDKRRTAIGMGTMAEYRVQMRKMYGRRRSYSTAPWQNQRRRLRS